MNIRILLEEKMLIILLMFPPCAFVVLKKVNVPLSVVDIEMLLQRCELFWIVILQTLTPIGMNNGALFNVML